MPNSCNPLSLLTAFIVPAACAPDEMPEQRDGAAFFVANCTACHGASGRGNGVIAADLPKTPTGLTLLTRTNGGTFPTARAFSYIYGDPGAGHLARVVPEFGGAMADDLVPIEVDSVLTPTPRALAGLLDYLEGTRR